MPDGYSVTSSWAIYDEKLLLLGNSVGSVYFLSLTSQKFLQSGLHYSDVIRSMGGLLKLVKEAKDNPIFKPIIRNAQVECDYAVVSIHSHPYIKFRVLVAFANNLAIIYDFEKERVDAVFDIFSAYNEVVEGGKKKLTAESNPWVIKEAKYSIDSFKIMVALDIGKVLVFTFGKLNDKFRPSNHFRLKESTNCVSEGR